MRYREPDWEAAFRFLHASAMTTSTTIPVFGLLAVLSVVVDRFGSSFKEWPAVRLLINSGRMEALALPRLVINFHREVPLQTTEIPTE